MEYSYTLEISGLRDGANIIMLGSGSAPATSRYSSSVPAPHAICSISSMTSSLDPLEPIVDSSQITIELAADAMCGDRTLRQVFFDRPAPVGTLASSCFTTDTTIQVEGQLSAGYYCCGSTSFYLGAPTYSGGITTGTITRSRGDQLCSLLVDRSLGYAPAVSTAPMVWRGRMALLYITARGQTRIYRACYICESPSISGASITLVLAPLDSRIRDRQTSATAPAEAHFQIGGRAYCAGTKSKLMFIEGWLSRQPVSLGNLTTTATTFSLGSATPAGRALYDVLQPVLTAVPGVSADASASGVLAAPLAPPLDGRNQILGRTATTGTLGRALGVSGITSVTLKPTLRAYVCSPISSKIGDRLLALATRSQTRATTPTTAANAEPVIYVEPLAAGTDVTLGANLLCDVPTDMVVGLYHRHVGAAEPTSMYADTPYVTALSKYYGVEPRAFTVADGDHSLEWLMGHDLDYYSVKPTGEADSSFSLPVKRHRQTDAAGSESIQVGRLQERTDFFVVDGAQTLKLVAAAEWWQQNEPRLCLDQTLFSEGEQWVRVKWTEDGETELETKLKLTYVMEAEQGTVYSVVERPDDIAGIGDWYGVQATFSLSTTMSSQDEALLLRRWVTGYADSKPGLWISADFVDASSFAQPYAVLPAVAEYRFADADAWDDGVTSILLATNTCLTYATAGGDYRVVHGFFGAGDRASGVLASYSDDELLTVPRAERQSDIVADYTLKLPNEKTFTFADAVAKQLFSAEGSLELDFSGCKLAEDATVESMRPVLMSLVGRFGSDRMVWSFDVPLDDGLDVAPGALVELSSGYTVGASASTMGTEVLRVTEVTQDLMGGRTSITGFSTAATAARYQPGLMVLSWGSRSITVSTSEAEAADLAAGSILLDSASAQYSVTSVTDNHDGTATIGLSVDCVATWLYTQPRPDRFLVASDLLA